MATRPASGKEVCIMCVCVCVCVYMMCVFMCACLLNIHTR